MRTSEAPAHPRSRGENLCVLFLALARPGLIPAHAGKTPTRGREVHPHEAHPRSRGENHRARGQDCPQARLIPAHAGKTRRWGPPRWAGGAHPRSRGENLPEAEKFERWVGSSPLTRGKQRRWRVKAVRVGLIPAHAGKTDVFYCESVVVGAHPRSRGENYGDSPEELAYRGSSPLTRGKLLDEVLGFEDCRLIPAHAGKTLRQRIEQRCDEAHPRSRGENFRTELMTPFIAGSSPLTRGKRRAEC